MNVDQEYRCRKFRIGIKTFVLILSQLLNIPVLRLTFPMARINTNMLKMMKNVHFTVLYI